MNNLPIGRIGRSLYAGFAFYCLFSILFGPSGLVSYRSLEGQNEAMLRNIVSLAARNEALRAELESLKSDPDRAAREARSLGYLGPGEMELVISGKLKENIENRKAGDILPLSRPDSLSDSALKELSLLVAVLVFAAVSVFEAAANPRRHRRERFHTASRT